MVVWMRLCVGEGEPAAGQECFELYLRDKGVAYLFRLFFPAAKYYMGTLSECRGNYSSLTWFDNLRKLKASSCDCLMRSYGICGEKWLPAIMIPPMYMSFTYFELEIIVNYHSICEILSFRTAKLN
jgi:hypothetical protein